MTIPLNQRKSEPGLCEILDQLADDIKTSMNCVSIGTIQSFNSVDQTATIQLSYKKINLYSGTPSDYQPLVKCPVVVLNGGGAYLSFPIVKGDSCIVLFCDREIDTWFTNGGVNPPQSTRVHDLNDGIALIGIRNSLNAIPNLGSGTRLAYGTKGYIDIDSSGNLIFSGSSLNIQSPTTIQSWASQSLLIDGYCWMGNLLLQWGLVSVGTDSDTTIYFPIPFPNSCFNIAGCQYSQSGQDVYLGGFSVLSFNNSSFVLRERQGAPGAYMYQAIGC